MRQWKAPVLARVRAVSSWFEREGNHTSRTGAARRMSGAAAAAAERAAAVRAPPAGAVKSTAGSGIAPPSLSWSRGLRAVLTELTRGAGPRARQSPRPGLQTAPTVVAAGQTSKDGVVCTSIVRIMCVCVCVCCSAPYPALALIYVQGRFIEEREQLH